MMRYGSKRVHSKPAGKSVKREMIGTRLTPETKKRLDEAVALSGRSVAQEVEFRLERSFERQDLLGEALTLAYGERVAGILLAMAEVMDHAGRLAAYRAIQSKKFAGGPLKDIDAWFEHAFAFEQALHGAIAVLEWARPDGRRDVLGALVSGVGREIAAATLDMLASEASALRQPQLSYDIDRLRSMLRPILQRSKRKPS